jgi:ribonuclease P protein component
MLQIGSQGRVECRTPTLTQTLRVDTFRSGSLTLAVRFIAKDSHEGQADFSAEHTASRENSWVSREDEHQERSSGSEAPARERPETSDGQQRVTSRAVAEFRRDERIRRRVEYQKVYDRGVKAHGRLFTLFALPTDLPRGRLGIAATRKLGGAVERNRAKRLIREVFRRNKPATAIDIVIVAKRELLDASLTALEREFRQVLSRSLHRTGAAPRL